MDGVGYLLYALLELDQVLKNPNAVVAQNKIVAINGGQKTVIALDTW
jgi:hypothetical protein